MTWHSCEVFPISPAFAMATTLSSAVYLSAPEGATTLSVMGGECGPTGDNLFGVQLQWQLQRPTEDDTMTCPDAQEWVGSGLENWWTLRIKCRLILLSGGNCGTAMDLPMDTTNEEDSEAAQDPTLAEVTRFSWPQLRLRQSEWAWLQSYTALQWHYGKISRGAKDLIWECLRIDFDIITPAPVIRIRVSTLSLTEITEHCMIDDVPDPDLSEPRNVPMPIPF